MAASAGVMASAIPDNQKARRLIKRNARRITSNTMKINQRLNGGNGEISISAYMAA